MKIGTVLVAILTTVMVGFEPCEASDAGRLCLAPVPDPTPGSKSLANPTGGNPKVTYSLRIDDRDWVDLSSKDVIWVDGLDLGKRHFVVIRGDGKQMESFYFIFEPSEPDLCLFLKPLYLEWILWPIAKTGDWCPCYASEKGEEGG
jgi:hypothetical protein